MIPRQRRGDLILARHDGVPHTVSLERRADGPRVIVESEAFTYVLPASPCVLLGVSAALLATRPDEVASGRVVIGDLGRQVLEHVRARRASVAA